MALAKLTALLLVASLGAFIVLRTGPRPGAVADLVDGQGRSVGRASFLETEAGVRIQGRLSSLPPGVHSLHLVSSDDCKSPESRYRTHPYGDLPQVEVKPDGSARLETLAPSATLKPGHHSLLPPGGACLVIDEKPAGPSLAHGEIRKP